MNALIDEHLPEGMFRPAVMAKIEKPSCFIGDELEKIVNLCDGIMVRKLLSYRIDCHLSFAYIHNN